MKTLVAGMLVAAVALTTPVAIDAAHAQVNPTRESCPPGMAIDSQGSGNVDGTGPCCEWSRMTRWSAGTSWAAIRARSSATRFAGSTNWENDRRRRSSPVTMPGCCGQRRDAVTDGPDWAGLVPL